MSKRNSGEASFAEVETAEQLVSALQKRLASGELTTSEIGAVELICELRGWTVDKNKAPKSKTDAIGGDQFGAKPGLVEEPHW
jgi:hypothetical protein